MYKKKYTILLITFALLSLSIKTNCWSKEYSEKVRNENLLNVHWVFSIDTSGSMKMKGHMDLLQLITTKITNEFLDSKKNIINTGDRITIFSFDKEVRLEATSLYQTENDLLSIKQKLKELNKRHGSLTFISEAIVQSMDVIDKYRQFFHTNALYVFTDGKSEPYSPKWSKRKIAVRKKRDTENFQKISLAGKDSGLNVWLGVLKWEAFEDAKSLVNRMGKGGHLVDLTNFNRLSLEKALIDFAGTVRAEVKLVDAKRLNLGTIPYNNKGSYQKNISLNMQTDKTNEPPSLTWAINFDPENPSEIKEKDLIEIKTTADKMVLSFKLTESNNLNSGTYKGKLKLIPAQSHYGALLIEPSQFEVKFRKSSVTAYYFWRIGVFLLIGSLLLMYLLNKIKRKMPIKV
jgi:Mg-chelatase subunit ChlD